MISKEKLKDHIEDHFAARRSLQMPPELENPDQYPHLQDEKMEIQEDQPTEEEVIKALASFKNNKSSGTDRLKTEGLKYNSSNNLVKSIVMLMALIWSCIRVPSTWLHADITCLYKKGIRSLASNYRGISIGTNMSRILSKIIVARLKNAYERHISNTQFDFRQNRSTTDGLFVMKNIIDKCGEPFVAVYIDLTAAYDHIPRDFLFKILKLRTGAPRLINIL